MQRFISVLSLLGILLASTTTYAQLGNISKNLKNTQDKIERELPKTPSLGKKDNTTTTTASRPSASESTSKAIAEGADYYVCAATGKGKVGSKEQPAKDISALAMQLKAGDRVHIAEGVYNSKMDQSTDVFEVPISVIGGYSPDFSRRDPWGAHKTVLSGSNDINKAATTERLGILTDKGYRDWKGEILVDGIVVDNGARNYFSDDKEVFIRRKGSPEMGKNPTPNTPGIKIRAGANTSVVIKNCVVTNVASSQGAIDVQVGKNGSALITNCLVVNNTGEGIMCKTLHQGAEGIPAFTVSHCTVLFAWKYDPIASHGGNCLKFDGNLTIAATDNVFGFGDYGGVDNIKQCKKVTLKNNLFVGHKLYDYREYNTNMSLGDLEDYANYLTSESGNNLSQTVQLQLDKTWAERYYNRKEISRAEVDASAKVSNSGANQLRGMFGLPLQASSVGTDAEVWLHRIQLEHVLACGLKAYGQSNGCTKP